MSQEGGPGCASVFVFVFVFAWAVDGEAIGCGRRISSGLLPMSFVPGRMDGCPDSLGGSSVLHALH